MDLMAGLEGIGMGGGDGGPTDTSADELFKDAPLSGQAQPAAAQPGMVAQPGTTAPRPLGGGEQLSPDKQPAPPPQQEVFHNATGQEIQQAIAQGVALDPKIPYRVSNTGKWEPIEGNKEPAAAQTPAQQAATDLQLQNQLLGQMQAAARSKERSINGWGFTGTPAEFTQHLPGPYSSFKGDLGIVGSNQAFDTMQRLKAAGVTPGRWNQQEFQAAKNVNVNLDPTQDPVSFQRNMDQVIENTWPAYVAAGGRLSRDQAFEPTFLWTGNHAGSPQDIAAQKAAAEGATGSQTPPPGGAGGGTPGGPTPPAPGTPGLVRDNVPNFDAAGNIIHDTSGQFIRGQDTGLYGEKGGTHSENDPNLAGVNATVNEMLKARMPAGAILHYLSTKETDPAQLAQLAGKVATLTAWQQGEGKNYKGNYIVDLERREVPNTAEQNFWGSDIGQGVNAALNASTGFNLDKIAALYGRDSDQFRQAQAAAAAAHPASTAVGTVLGGAATATGLAAAARAAGLGDAAAAALSRGGPGTVAESLAPLAEKAVPTTAADVAYGGGTGASTTNYGPGGKPATLGERLEGGAEGAAGALVGSLGGQAVAAPVEASASPAANEDVAAVNAAGIPTTIGDQYGQSGLAGKIIKGTENKLTSVPGVGEMITARKMQAIQKYNENQFDHALAPIGEKANGTIANEGVASAQEKVSQAFESALNGKEVTPDKDFSTDLGNSMDDLHGIETVGPQLFQQVYTALKPFFAEGKTSFTGEDMQTIDRVLQQIKKDYGNHVQSSIIGPAIDNVRDSFFGMFKRQTPEVMPAYNAAKVAQARLGTVADAVLSASNKNGIFLPSQLGQADKAQSIRAMGRIGTASGDSSFFGSQRAAQNVLPSTVPDSGSAGRIGTMAMIMEGVQHPWWGLKAATLGGLYSRLGQRILTKPGRGFTSPTGQALASGAAPVIPHIAAAEGRRKANTPTQPLNLPNLSSSPLTPPPQ
jgi:hypothetical protein